MPVPTRSAHTAACTHQVQFYRDDSFLLDRLLAYAGAGVERGQGVLLVVEAAKAKVLRRRMRGDGICDRAFADGRVVILDAAETLASFMRGGMPDPQAFVGAVGAALGPLLERCGGVRAYGEMVDILWRNSQGEATLALERLWTRLIAELPVELLCGYRLSGFASCAHEAAFVGICDAHAHIHPAEDESRCLAQLQQRSAALDAERATLLETQARLRRSEAELERRVRELERSNAELESFAYIASHDLQEPMRMITAYLQLIERQVGPSLDGKMRTFFGFVTGGARRMQEMVRSILDYSRIGRNTDPAETVDMERSLRRALQGLERQVLDSGAEIEIGALPALRGYPAELERLWQNLVANALKFRAVDRPRVRISAELAAGGWDFAVRDNGIGIPERDAGRIFGLFQRLHPSDVYPGTGIGLAACKKIVEHHGGRIWFESHPGVGTTFRFTLPEAARSACDEAAPALASSSVSAAG